MKYIITESQFDKIASLYLNERDFVKYKNSSDCVYFLDSENNVYSQIYYEPDGNCYISNKLIKQVSNFSSLNTIESQQAIGRWVENNIGSPVNKTHGIHTIYFNNPQ